MGTVITAPFGRHVHRACPLCAGPALRVSRHWLDRLLGIWVPSWRYRCMAASCGWAGLLLQQPQAPSSRRLGHGHSRPGIRPLESARHGAPVAAVRPLVRR